jgi:hypothetical protein
MPDLTGFFTDARGTSVAARARRRRFDALVARFPALGRMRVLDLGGEAHTWQQLRVHPREVVLLNIPWVADAQREQLEGTPEGDWIEPLGGDACAPPDEVREDHFDLVYSNSVIEHVGGHHRRRQFAFFAQTLGDRYWIQTPNRWFPIEPHWLFPGFQFLPAPVRATASRFWPVGGFAHTRRSSFRDRLQEVVEIELLTRQELSLYFPDAEILRERVGPLTKSLIATG